MNESNIELIGYLASALVAISFTIKNINQLRIVNSIGCVAFIIYGVFIDSTPVMITNAFIIVFNIYYLWIKKQ